MLTKRTIVVGALGGSAAGMMMAAVEMLYGWVSSAHTAWDAPMAIWSWVAGIEHFGRPGNHVGAIVLGMGGHMMNSMLAGVMFVAVMRMLRDPRAALVLGPGYGLALWAIMRYVVLPLNDGESALFTSGLVSPQWVWWSAHVALGMTAGLAYALFGERRPGTDAASRAEAEPLRRPQLRRTA